MDELRLNNGLPTHRSYYDKLIKSGRIARKRTDNSSKKPEESIDGDQHDQGGNPFVHGADPSGLDLSSEAGERSKSKNYAMRSKSLQDLKNKRRDIGKGSHDENGMNSDYFQCLYNRYPHSFHRKTLNDSRRPSRRMFNSGLHVHFDDEVHYDDDARSISSERMHVTKWDREMEKIFGHHRHPRSCLTSPTPSLILDRAERHSEYGATRGSSLPRSLSHVISYGHRFGENNGELKSQVRNHRASYSESDNTPERIKLLELELEKKEKQLQSYRSRLESPQITGSAFSDSSHWRAFCPDSPPDSAIDLDSSSVQSSNLGPAHLSPRNDKILFETNGGQGNRDILRQEKRWSYAGGYQQQNDNMLLNYNKDSDVDSGIAQPLPRTRSDKSRRDLYNGASMWEEYHSSRRPMSAVEFSHQGLAPDKLEFLGMWNKAGSKKSRRRDSDDDSIIQEIQHNPVLSGYQFRSVHQQEEEEVDDSDPSLGLPTITEDDLFVREVYQQRKKPTPYKIVKRCLTARANSAPTWKNCVSGSNASVLCTPRRTDKTFNFDPVDPKREERRESVQTFKCKSESSLLEKSEPGAFFRDDGAFKFNPKLEQKIRRHSRKLSGSSDSDYSEKTLISSQIALNADIDNQFTHKHRLQKTPTTSEDCKDCISTESLSSDDEDPSRSGLTKPEVKQQFKKDLKQADLNEDHVRHLEEVDTGSSSLSGPERLTPYEASVIKMDRLGLDVEDIIESDSDNVFATPLTFEKDPKSDDQGMNIKNKSRENGTKTYVSVSRESSASLPESVNSEPLSGSPDLSLESDNNHVFQDNAGPQTGLMEDIYDPQDSDYATVVCSDDEGIRQLAITVDQRRDRKEDKSDTSHPIYAKVKRVNRKLDMGDSETEKGKLNGPEEGVRPHDDRAYSFTSSGAECGSMLSREVSQSTPNVAGTSHNNNQDVPPLPVRNYGSTTNLSKSKELSGSRISLSNKMSNFKAAAKSKFKTLRKAVSLDKGINKTQGEFRPEELEFPSDVPPQGKPPKPKKGRSLKKFFARRSTKHKSAEFSGHGGVMESTNKELVTGPCSSIESRTSEEEVSVSQLREVHSDGTQTVELNRRHKGPIGFYIARGSTQFKHGIFVSRFSEEADADERFAGLLNVGDEILEVNGFNISDASLDDVYDLMADQTLIVKILPLLSRKDIHEEHR